MKKIAITQRLVRIEVYEEIRETLDVNYAKLLKKAGFLPIALPYEVYFEDYFEEFDIKGVILSGGNDLFTCSQNRLSKKRDEFEKEILGFCIEKQIPVLGICRGMQLIAEYFGSSFKSVSEQVGTKHALHVNESSKYVRLLEKLDEVNSYHDFAIDSLGNELVVSAFCEDGMIKAIEHKDYKIFGQMWHSERENPFVENEMNLIREVLI